MVYKQEVKGNFVKLRSVLEEDAQFILSLRLDSNINKYLNKVDNNLKKQKEWIKKQQSNQGDYYFIMLDLNDEPIGTISLYDIEKGEGYYGRWVSIGNSIENVESVILLHDFGFDILGLKRIYSRTIKKNKKVLSFHKRFGANVLNKYIEDPIGGFILQEAEINKEDYKLIREENMKIINSFKK